jgi:hypothetical protein
MTARQDTGIEDTSQKTTEEHSQTETADRDRAKTLTVKEDIVIQGT